jgi:hypothetical protein
MGFCLFDRLDRAAKIAELEYVMEPSIRVVSKIKENRSVNPLFAILFNQKDRNRGSLFRYIRGCNEIWGDNGIQFLYLRQRVAPASSNGICHSFFA